MFCSWKIICWCCQKKRIKISSRWPTPNFWREISCRMRVSKLEDNLYLSKVEAGRWNSLWYLCFQNLKMGDHGSIGVLFHRGKQRRNPTGQKEGLREMEIMEEIESEKSSFSTSCCLLPGRKATQKREIWKRGRGRENEGNRTLFFSQIWELNHVHAILLPQLSFLWGGRGGRIGSQELSQDYFEHATLPLPQPLWSAAVVFWSYPWK